MKAIEAEGLSKCFHLYRERPASIQERLMGRRAKYDEIWALKRVSFAVEEGEIVGIIGRNASGKSTLLKVMSHIYPPTEGKFHIRGKLASVIELGAGVHPDLTGRENSFLYGAVLGLTRRQIRDLLPEIIEFSELGEFFDVPIRTYSLGMIFRLLVSISLLSRPNIFFLDEIVGVGDATFQLKCFAHLHHLARQGVSVLLVSHNMTVIRQLCHRVLFLEEGQLMGNGSPDSVIQQYLMFLQKRQPVALKPTGPGGMRIERRKWGTGKIVIQSVTLLNSAGESTTVFRPLEPMTIRFQIFAPEKVGGYALTLQWHLADGTPLDGPQVFLHRKPFVGHACVDYVFDALPFVRNSFLISAAIYDTEHPSIPGDYHEKMYELTVMDEGILDAPGFLKLPAKWLVRDEQTP